MESVVTVINAPAQLMLNWVKNLLSNPINIQAFSSVWAIIIYMLSMFYAFLIIYSGFMFITSGYDASKREKAKEWLKNIIIMIILIQGSFFIYQLFLDLSSTMTASTLTLTSPNFFLLNVDNNASIGLQLILGGFFLVTLLFTSLFLVIRYAIVGVGVILFPLSIFFYFIPALKPYGLLILNFLGVSIFITFLDAILIIGFSQLMALDSFSNLKMLVMIACFLIINIVMFFLMFFSIVKAAWNVGSKIAAVAASLG